MSLLDEDGSSVRPAGTFVEADPLFETVDPDWTGKAKVLKVQRQIAVEVVGAKRLLSGGFVTVDIDEGPVLPGSMEAVRLMTAEPGELLRASGPDRRRSQRRRRRPGMVRVVMTGLVEARDDFAIGVALTPEGGTLGEDELIMQFPLRSLPQPLRSRLRIGVVFEFITNQWVNAAGNLASESEFVIREPREFTAEERRRIEQRATEFRDAIGEASADSIL